MATDPPHFAERPWRAARLNSTFGRPILQARYPREYLQDLLNGDFHLRLKPVGVWYRHHPVVLRVKAAIKELRPAGIMLGEKNWLEDSIKTNHLLPAKMHPIGPSMHGDTAMKASARLDFVANRSPKPYQIQSSCSVPEHHRWVLHEMELDQCRPLATKYCVRQSSAMRPQDHLVP